MEHFIIDKSVIISVQHLSHKENLPALLTSKLIREASEPSHKIHIKAVGYIKPYPVYSKIFNPVSHRIENERDDILISKINLYKVIIAFPALIPQSVIIT